MIRRSSGRLKVTWVLGESPAEKAGLEKGDELLAVDGVPRNSEGELNSYLQLCPPGANVALLVSRRGHLTHLQLPVSKRPDTPKWKLQIDPAASPESRANWEAFLKG